MAEDKKKRNGVIHLLPVGSFEFHGNSIPLDIDTVIAAGVSEHLFINLQTVFTEIHLLPVLPFGVSLEHRFNRAWSVDSESYISFLKKGIKEYALTFGEGIEIFVLINAHGGNLPSLNAVEQDLNHSIFTNKRQRILALHVYSQKVQQRAEHIFGSFDTHGGSVEFSLYELFKKTKLDLSHLNIAQGVKKFSQSLRFFSLSELNDSGLVLDHKKIIIDPIKAKQLLSFMTKCLIQNIVELYEKIQILYE